MNTTRIGIDLAKSVFEVALSRTPGRVDVRQRLARGRMHPFFAQHESAEIVTEACGSAHHWGRELEAMGHRVSLLHPGDVARYRDGNKTDRADAKALLEAARNEDIDRVPLKSIDQQALGALHRLREGYLPPGREVQAEQTSSLDAYRVSSKPELESEPLMLTSGNRLPVPSTDGVGEKSERVVHGLGIAEDLCHVGIEDDNVRSFGKTAGILAAHGSAEVVLGPHIGIRVSGTVLLHTVDVRAASRHGR